MTLTRVAIRRAVADAIRAAGTALGTRVAASRVDPYEHEELPAGSVYTRGETITLLSSDPIHQARTVELAVEIIVQAHGQVDDVIDTIAEAVEVAVWESEALDDLISDLDLVRVEGPVVDERGELPLAGLVLAWQVVYEQKRGVAPETAGDFERVHAELETHTPRAGAEAEADFELEVAP